MAEEKLLGRSDNDVTQIYSVSARWLVSTFEFNSSREEHRFMWDKKVRIGSAFPLSSPDLNNHKSCGAFLNQPRVIRCWHIDPRGRDRTTDLGEVRAFMFASRHHRERAILVFEDLKFRLAFRMSPIRSRFWLIWPDIILALSHSTEQWNSINIDFFSAITWDKYG